ncbi:MAG: 3'-5' exonuclease [Defluviitoga tunisiensis]|uniref:DNA polymerase III epsilon subunit n=1 Tax=Defluviitoga tunisiensis TaxID=1006576 RepID=A0A0C7P3P9_DEFTU|nr:3'-5' exonuclease [Defluviitoga tunisiensis]MDD3601539.1 3'-5' exonuclease [Defluviitoga tunisiensis]MDY0379605.1 3'-5' exonuclease [Defluviitoga tunisiensis]CEP78504.1 DNA polymerase III epsilon subunit [Defluviitoga tunisiensis]HHV00685.1 3'-5' exonuclease [Defluviitoga tunisiensis]HOB55927.1 3'-5' exonuclease [Defluviitoga tunisiensis]
MLEIQNNVFLAFDLETTGLSPEYGDRIIEIAAIPIFNKKIKFKYSFHTLVNPMIFIPGEVSRFHKLNNEDVSQAPLLIDVFPRFKEYIDDSILVSHNAKMDLRFLDIAAKESGMFSIDNYYIDTLEVSKYFLESGPYNLEHLSNKFNLGINKFHRAWDDALATARLFQKYINLFSLKALENFIRKWGD